MKYNKETQVRQPKHLNIAIDLRPLNYPILTGINIYCLHFLREIANIKKNLNINITITGIGLKKEQQQKLVRNYDFLINLIDSHLQLSEYTKLKISNNRFLNILMLLSGQIFGFYNFTNIQEYDYLFLTQPKPLWKNPRTKQIAIFYDIYSTLEPKSTNFTNRFFTKKNIYQLIINKSNKIWTTSISTAWDLVKVLKTPNEKIKVIYPASTDIIQSNSLTFETIKLPKLPKKYILALSGIEKRKNWFNLVLAHHKLQQKGIKNYSLVLAGRIVDMHYYQKIIKVIDKLQVKNVIWILNPDETQKTRLIQKALFIAYPSFYEGFGFPILEAFSQGKCVITSKISSMPEIAQNGAVYINPLNYLDISRGMEILLTNSVFRRELEKNANKILRNYTWLETRNAIESILIT